MTYFYTKYRLQLLITLILLLLLALFMVLAPRTFLSSRIYIAYMSTIPFTAMMAIFMTLVIISGEIDLSFPSIMATGGFIFAIIFLKTSSPAFAILGAILIGGIAGCINGFIVVKIGVPTIIATIGTQFFWRGATVLISGGLSLSLVDFRTSLIHHCLTGRLWGGIPSQALWTRMIYGIIVIVAVSMYAIIQKKDI